MIVSAIYIFPHGETQAQQVTILDIFPLSGT